LTELNVVQATAEDLARASAQGTITEITVDGVRYGSGVIGTFSPAFLKSLENLSVDDFLSLDVLTLVVGGGMLLGVFIFLTLMQLEPKRQRRRRREDLPEWFQERFIHDEKSVDEIRLEKPVSTTVVEDESISGGEGCQAAEDRLADMWLIFSPNTDLDELEENVTMESATDSVDS
jgi:hypothetical protein